MNRQALLASLQERHTEKRPHRKNPALEQSYSEHHYRINDLAKLWSLSPTKITTMFRDVPGVVRVGRTEGSPGKQRYVTLLIPASVAQRVYGGMVSVQEEAADATRYPHP